MTPLKKSSCYTVILPQETIDHAKITGGIPSTNFLPEKSEYGTDKSVSGYVHKTGQRHN